MLHNTTGMTLLKVHVPFPLLRSYQGISPGPRNMYPFRNKVSFYDEKLSAPRPTPKLEDHPLSAVLHCLFNIFVAALHTGGRSSIRNLRTRHTVVTATQPTTVELIRRVNKSTEPANEALL
jgi:hypothetical protein